VSIEEFVPYTGPLRITLESMRLGLAFALVACVACHTSTQEQPADAHVETECDAGSDAIADAPPWLHDAGLVTRAPAQRPLRDSCGIATVLPTGADPTSVAERAAYFAVAHDLGFPIYRTEFSWSQIETAKNQFMWAPYDTLVGEAEEAGVKLLAQLGSTPGWAAIDPGAGGGSAPTNASDFAAFAAAVTARYSGKLAAVEVWNEENAGYRFWEPSLGGDAAAYGQLLSKAHDSVVATDPSMPVAFGGCTFDPQIIPGAIQFETSAFAATPGLSTKFELFAIHAYELYPPVSPPEYGSTTETPLVDKIEEQAWLLSKHSASDVPIWITEIGWPTSTSTGLDDAEQARYLVRATILAAWAGADATFWWTLMSGPDPNAFPPEDGFGILNDDGLGAPDGGNPDSGLGTPKRAYVALKALLSTVGARWPSVAAPAVEGLPSDGFAIAFRGTDAGTIVALWTVSSTATVTVTGAKGTVLGILGTPQGSADQGFAIGPDPVYVSIP
jgi:Cellulase (glycosyl hydrolase family 5)